MLVSAFSIIPIEAQLSTNMQSMMRRINSGEFSGEFRGGRGSRGGRGGGGGQQHWVEGGRGYTTIERGDIVRYDTATGNREVLMPAKELTPPKMERALAPIESGSTNANRMLFATNPRNVMIRKTANDYWVLDKTDASWEKRIAVCFTRSFRRTARPPRMFAATVFTSKESAPARLSSSPLTVLKISSTAHPIG
jgi:hypothetical protein